MALKYQGAKTLAILFATAAIVTAGFGATAADAQTRKRVVVDDPTSLASVGFTGLYCAFALFFGVTWPVMYVVTPAAFPASSRSRKIFLDSGYLYVKNRPRESPQGGLLPPAPKG